MEKERQKQEQELDKIFSVSEYIETINQGIKKFKVKIIGEIGEVNVWATGHVSFSLKDEKEKGLINCIIWKSRYQLYGIELKEGLKIIAFGYSEIYPPTGRISFLAETIEYAGEGELKKEYERIKKKLSQEGIFDKERKRPIPLYPQKIGLITSLKGAVIADFSNNLGKFGFKVKMIDCRVEGQTAVEDLLKSIKRFKKEKIETLVIMRGGGSLESMIAFNNELLVREVANFPVPIIAAIGHHKDVSLVALASDLSVSTPSIAATVLSESWNEINILLEKHGKNIINNCQEFLSSIKSNLKDLTDDIFSGFESLLLKVKQKIEYAEKIIKLNDPKRQLALGFSLVWYNNKIIKSVKNIKIEDRIDIQMSDGKIISKVKKINKNG